MKKAFLAVLLIFLGCTQAPVQIPLTIPRDGLYDSAYPYTDVAHQLDRVSRSVLKIYFTAFYNNYFFSPDDSVSNGDLPAALAEKRYERKISFNRSSFGTATVIASEDGRSLLLSCAHIGNFPDTIRTWYSDEAGLSNRLESVAIKTRSNFFADHDQLKGNLRLIASDKTRDIALFGHEQTGSDIFPVSVFPFPFGRMDKVTWGSLVYLMGYPIGHKMVTQALVSLDEDDGNNSFLVDALFNKGFSGGVVLAVMDGIPNFELVGLAKSISAQTDYYLAPDSRDVLHYSTNPNAYEGNIYIVPKRTLHYGVTYCVTVDAITDFLRFSKAKIRRLGYPFPTLENEP